MYSLLLRGFALGFAVAASPGPIFFLCLRPTLLRGRLCGLISGFGVATADGPYAALATLGVAALTTALVSGRRPLALIGVLLGSATWWAVLAVVVSRLRSRMTPAVVRAISVFSGLAIIVLGALAVYSAVAT